MTAPTRPPYRPADLQRLFAPRSIAVVGVSANPAAFGSVTYSNIADRGGYAGPLYMVNARYDRIRERTCYPSIAALPESERERTAHALSTATMEIHWSPRSLVNPTGAESQRITLVRRRLRELLPDIVDDQIRLAFADEGVPLHLVIRFEGLARVTCG